MTSALVLPGLELAAGTWQQRTASDRAVRALADRHYTRTRHGLGAATVGPPGRRLVLCTADERAAWITHWPAGPGARDGLDAWRCSLFRNEGPHLSSQLILAAMAATAQLWADRPADGWLTWVDRRAVRSQNPGWCFMCAGWWRDRTWTAGSWAPGLIRLRAAL